MAKVNVGTTSTPIMTSWGGVRNMGPGVLYLGSGLATVADGFPVMPGEAIVYQQNYLHGISDSTCEVRTLAAIVDAG